MIKFKIMI